MKRLLIAIACVWALAGGARPAHAALREAFPQVSFSGYVQGIGQQTATVETTYGAVVVPCDNSQFLASGVETSPFALPVGAPVVVSLPAAAAPQLAVANLEPVPYGAAAFPGTFSSYLVTTSGPTLYEPAPPAVALLNQAPVQYSYESVAPVSYTASWPAVPPAPLVSYNAFEPPAWTGACTNDVAYESDWETAAPTLAAYAPCAWGMPMVPEPVYEPYPFWDTSSFAFNVAEPGFSLGYAAFSPGYGYGYPYPYGSPYGFGFNQASIGLNLGDVSLGFSSFGSPSGGGYSSFGIGFNGFSLGFGSFNPGLPAYPAVYPTPYPDPAFAGFGYPGFGYGGYGYGGYPGFNGFVGPTTPLYPCFQPGFVQTAFAGPMMGTAVGFQNNACLVQTSNGLVSIPTAALPGSVLNQNVFVRDPRGQVSQVPLQAALAMRHEGARLLTDPRIPNSALLSNVAVADPRGRVHSATLGSALQNRRSTILGAAGAGTTLHHVGRAAMATSRRQYGLIQPARPFGPGNARLTRGSNGAAFPRMGTSYNRAAGLRPSMGTRPSFNRGMTSAARPSFNRSPAYRPSMNRAPAYRPSMNRAPAYRPSMNRAPAYRPSMNRAPAYRPSMNRAPAYRPSMNRAPAYRPGYRPAAPAYHPTYRPAAPAYHPTYRPAAPAYHPTFSRPAPAYSAPRPVFRAPQPAFRAPAPMMRAPAPAMRAPAPVMRAPAPMMGPRR